MNYVALLLSLIPDLTSLEQLAAADLADFPATRGHGELIAYFIRHQADIGKAQAIVADIVAKYQAAQPKALALGAEDLHEAIVSQSSLQGISLATVIQGLRMLEAIMPSIPALAPYAATIDSVIELLIKSLGG